MNSEHSLFFVSPITAEVFRVRNGIFCFAEVEMDIHLIASERVQFRLAGEGFTSQGNLENASETGYRHWEAGATAGVAFALSVMDAKGVGVVITRMTGRDAIDTNPWIVGEAAAKGLWQSAEFNPPPELVKQLEQFVSESWTFPETTVPDFSHLL